MSQAASSHRLYIHMTPRRHHFDSAPARAAAVTSSLGVSKRSNTEDMAAWRLLTVGPGHTASLRPLQASQDKFCSMWYDVITINGSRSAPCTPGARCFTAHFNQ